MAQKKEKNSPLKQDVKEWTKMADDVAKQTGTAHPKTRLAVKKAIQRFVEATEMKIK